MRANNWVLEPGKFLSFGEVRRLLRCARQRANASTGKVAIRDYLLVHLALSTGLRVMEIASLKCGDLFLDSRPCSVLVRNGKGSKKRLVFFSGELEKHSRDYLKWKRQHGELIESNSPLLVSSNTGKELTTRALQSAFKRSAKYAGLSNRYSIHCLRHYAE